LFACILKNPFILNLYLFLNIRKNISQINNSINNNSICDSSKIQKGEQLIIATHNSITFLKATNENGKILPGDYLAASSKAGYAMKADENSIVLIGRALEPLNTSEGKISAFVQISNNNILNINKERLIEKDESELHEIEDEYDIDLKEIKQIKSSKETKIERIKKKLDLKLELSNVSQQTSQPAAQPSYAESFITPYITKVNGSVIIRIG